MNSNNNEETTMNEETEPKDGRASYSPEDNKLRLFVGRVLRDEYLALQAEGWTSTPKQDSDFVATWSPVRVATCLRYADEIEDEDQPAAERAADRAERFIGYRDERLEEATGHADRFNEQPQAHGYQSERRAERAAARHDRIGTRAVSSWDKAEYWQRRTAGVISHALYKSTPGVRMGRIKELESLIRKAENSRAVYTSERDMWLRCAEMTDTQAQNERAKKLAYIVHGDYIHPRTRKKSYLYDFTKTEEGEQSDPLNGAELCALYLAKHGELAPEGEWLTHYRLRLAYENQMLEASGGRAGTVEMEAGGFIGSHQITKVCKSAASGRVTSVEVEYMSECNQYGRPWSDGKGARMMKHLINVERMGQNIYTPPTDEQRAEFAAKMKAAKKEKAGIAKEKAANGENCPLINPTDEDAERLQALINERYLTPILERHKANAKYYGGDKVGTIQRMPQAFYSAHSKGSYARAEAVELCGDAMFKRRRGSVGPAVCKIRVTGYDPYSVIIITDKPQKPLPAKVWEKVAELAEV